MVTATQLSSYLYCPRKLFISDVLKIRAPIKEELVKGKVWHSTYELINTGEEKIVSSITQESSSYTEVYSIYRKFFSKFLRDSIIINKTALKEFQISLLDLFKEYWPSFDNEAKDRALNVCKSIERNKVYGKELWEILTPKIMSEQYYKSEKLNLSGIIDVIEVHDIAGKKTYLPIELKTGKVPDKGMWDGHRVQLAAYIMLLKELGFDSTEGVLQYKDTERRILHMNSMLNEEVLMLVKKVNELIKSFDVPNYVDNKNKCKSCPFKDTCYDSTEMKTLVEKAKSDKLKLK